MFTEFVVRLNTSNCLPSAQLLHLPIQACASRGCWLHELLTNTRSYIWLQDAVID